MEDQNILDANQDTPRYARYGNFGERLVAYLIDAVILYVVNMAIGLVIGGGGIAAASAMEGDEAGAVALIGAMMGTFSILLIVNVAYFTYFESSAKQATFGKQAMGLVVTDMDGNRLTPLNALGRYLSKIISAIILMIGFIMQAFDAKGQALHDKIAGTLVYKK